MQCIRNTWAPCRLFRLSLNHRADRGERVKLVPGGTEFNPSSLELAKGYRDVITGRQWGFHSDRSDKRGLSVNISDTHCVTTEKLTR
ncbi:hypothetical protein DFR70_12027 [Nocardia tenerifensis]|uniref:Uncharacterized protein n=1 Tax=Nocardia tenerifensis TaxID=228006 RepID=A0A318JUH9_9NOCA|nr:hypothetical protein DFR70_12027 [Nocardia tenerifensis]